MAVIQAIGTTLSHAAVIQAIGTTLSHAAVIQAIRTALGHAPVIEAIRTTLHHKGEPSLLCRSDWSKGQFLWPAVPSNLH